MKQLTTIMLALVGIASVHAQTITNSGLGIAGNGITAATQAYNIDITEYGSCIVINGSYYPVLPPNASSPLAQVVKWDAVKNQWAPFGLIRAVTYDGKQFLGGTIFIRTVPRMKVMSFKAIKFLTPTSMPYVVTRNDILAYVWTTFTADINNPNGTYVPAPWLTIRSPVTSGAIWIRNGVIQSAILDGNIPSQNSIDTSGGVQIIPAPSGPTTPELMPHKMR